MVSLKSNKNGFTIIELLIVVILIAILGTLIVVTRGSVEQKNRNTERTNDIKQIATHLEQYNAVAGYYPSAANLNDSKFISDQLKGFDFTLTCDPHAHSTKNNVNKPPCVFSDSVLSAPGQYSYIPSPSGCSDNDNNDCTSFVLSYFQEGENTPTNVNSLSN